jgi:hypothetical protein
MYHGLISMQVISTFSYMISRSFPIIVVKSDNGENDDLQIGT